jgi:hypothetical protein
VFLTHQRQRIAAWGVSWRSTVIQLRTARALAQSDLLRLLRLLRGVVSA